MRSLALSCVVVLAGLSHGCFPSASAQPAPAEVLEEASTPPADPLGDDDDSAAPVVDPLDPDGDGRPDPLDECPLQPETINGYLDHDGCPDQEPVQVEMVVVLEDDDTEDAEEDDDVPLGVETVEDPEIEYGQQVQMQVQDVIDTHLETKDSIDKRNLEWYQWLLENDPEEAARLAEEIVKIKEEAVEGN